MTPVIFRDVNFHIYKISPDCRIFKNGDNIKLEDIIYRSTNGYDYILLETLTGNLKLYRLEFLIYNSFHPEIGLTHYHFKVIHKDGDIHNCNINNLQYADDIEEWRPVTQPDIIKQNMYLISSWGRIKSINTNSYMKCGVDKDGYPKIKLRGSDIRGRPVYTHPHRLVACNFITNPNPKEYITVNHIDGDKFNNHVSNLEWHSWLLNNRHAMRCGINTHKGHPIITSDEINMIVDMLLDPKYKASPSIINSAIDHDLHPLLSNKTVTAIKCKDETYAKRCTKYDLNTLSFDCCRVPLSDAEIDMISEMLSDEKYNNSAIKVYNAIDHSRYPNITFRMITHVKYGDYKRYNTKYYKCKQS